MDLVQVINGRTKVRKKKKSKVKKVSKQKLPGGSLFLPEPDVMPMPISHVLQVRKRKVQIALAHITNGTDVKEACERAGITVEWLNRYASKEEKFAALQNRSLVLYNRLEEADRLLARGEMQPAAHATLTKSIQWQLSKLDRKLFGDVTKNETEVKVSGSLEHEVSPALLDSIRNMKNVIDAEFREIHAEPRKELN